MSELALEPVDALLEELKRRFTHLIVSGLQITGHATDQEVTVWHGHAVMCQGLAADLIRQIQDAEREEDAA